MHIADKVASKSNLNHIKRSHDITMKVFDTIRDFFGATKASGVSGQEESIGVKTVADYLKLVGMDIEVSLHDSPLRFRGKLTDLSDDCQKLILRDVTEYDDARMGSPVVDMQDKKLIAVTEVSIVRVCDMHPNTDDAYWRT